MTHEVHKGLPVAGYTPQTTDAISVVNENKRMEEIVLQHLDELAERQGVDQRWYAIGRTHIEQGFMAVNRAVFKPQRMDLDAI